MICPKCHNEVSGKWCQNCGARVEADDFDIMQYNNQSYNKDVARIVNRQKSAHSRKNPGERSPVGIIVLIFVLMIVLVSLIITIIFSAQKPEKTTDTEPVVNSAVTEDNVAKELTAKAERYMEIGNYEEAEKICKEIIENHDNNKAVTMYKILYNYNNALRELSNYKYKGARRFFDKIPSEYVDYPIASDIDTLDEEISSLKVAYEILESISAFMDAKDYKAAEQEISIINSDLLSPDDKALLESYKKEIADNDESKKDDEKDENKKGDLTKEKNDLSMHEAEDLVHGYCEALVKSTKEGNFDILAPYMHPDSGIYSTQKKTVNEYINAGTTIDIDSFTIESVNKIDNDKWSVKISERETLSYANGAKEQFNYARSYTVEYIDSSFYITAIS